MRILSSIWQFILKTFILKTVLPLVRCFAILYCLLKISEKITSYLPIQLPASIIAMAILFLLMALQIIPMTWMRFGCQLIIKYMALFFIPATMGMMDTYQALIHDFIPILGGNLFSTLIVFLVVVFLADKFAKQKEDKQAKQEELE